MGGGVEKFHSESLADAKRLLAATAEHPLPVRKCRQEAPVVGIGHIQRLPLAAAETLGRCNRDKAAGVSSECINALPGTGDDRGAAGSWHIGQLLVFHPYEGDGLKKAQKEVDSFHIQR